MTHFWETKTLNEMTEEEWESVCDGCGQCCLHKLQDADTEQIALTNVACKLLNIKSCRCTHYEQRLSYVPECIPLRQHDIVGFSWLPSTCAYRLLSQNKPLPVWHPLRTGKSNSVHTSKNSVRHIAISEADSKNVGDLEDHIIAWID